MSLSLPMPARHADHFWAGRSALCIAVLAATTAVGCKTNPGEDSANVPRPPEQIGAPALAPSASGSGGSEADRYFKARCASCHGETAHANGPALAALKLKHKPRDYSDQEWQNSISDEEITRTILYGGASVGKSPDMPAFGDLQGKPELVNQLVAKIRAFGKHD